ncbi:MAG: NADP-dependent malic enzyme [Fervidicoccaceae archaeon]
MQLVRGKKSWYELAERLHREFRGKIEVLPKVPMGSPDEFSIWYTPGVAEPSSKIWRGGPDLSLFYTWRWNAAAVVSDGSRVLGLGHVGPEASLPVLEGKALLFKYLGGVDAVPIALRVGSADEFVEVVKALEPSFGAINIEDVASPKCFYVLERLEKELDVPVWHDDQQGTALVNIAALINALKLVGKKIEQVRIALIGAGAANVALYRYLKVIGVRPRNVVVVDSKGILRPDREDAEALRIENPRKYEIAVETSPEMRGGIAEAMRGADVVVAASRPGPGVIKKEWVAAMERDAIVFAEANPVPEIWPWEAKEAGARIVATGRSDFPNQINNSLGFPAVFRGILSAGAVKMHDEMFVAAARALASYAEETGLSEDRILPSMWEEEAYVREALAVAEKAFELGLARRRISRSELEAEIRDMISRPKRYLDAARRAGLVGEIQA